MSKYSEKNITFKILGENYLKTRIYKFFILFFGFILDIWQNKFLIYQLTKRDFQNKYIGSSLGFIWTIINPFVMLFILWMVFEKAFAAGPVNNIPFFVWLMSGLISWDFFSNTLVGSTNVFQEYSYLVKKINFRIAILPIVKILSSFFTHLILLFISIIILFVNDIPFSWYWFQIFYYLFALNVLLLGISWITSSLQVFLKDMSQIINIIIQFGFWITPIVWNYADTLTGQSLLFIKFNPMFYIIEGYRNSFLFEKPFWELPEQTFYFWTVTLIILIIGVFLFRKLRPHFADVL